MDVTKTEAFAHEWLAAWNSHDLERMRIMGHYHEDVEFRSPSLLASAAWWSCIATNSGGPWPSR